MSGRRASGWRLWLGMNLAVWAMLALTLGLLHLWVAPTDSFLLMGVLIGLAFTLLSLTWRGE